VPFQTIFAKLLARHDADCCRKACCSDSAHEVRTALAPCSPLRREQRIGQSTSLPCGECACDTNGKTSSARSCRAYSVYSFSSSSSASCTDRRLG